MGNLFQIIFKQCPVWASILEYIVIPMWLQRLIIACLVVGLGCYFIAVISYHITLHSFSPHYGDSKHIRLQMKMEPRCPGCRVSLQANLFQLTRCGLRWIRGEVVPTTMKKHYIKCRCEFNDKSFAWSKKECILFTKRLENAYLADYKLIPRVTPWSCKTHPPYALHVLWFMKFHNILRTI